MWLSEHNNAIVDTIQYNNTTQEVVSLAPSLRQKTERIDSTMLIMLLSAKSQLKRNIEQ